MGRKSFRTLFWSYVILSTHLYAWWKYVKVVFKVLLGNGSMPFLMRIRKLSKERQKRLNEASKFLKVEEGNRKKWDFRFWERWIRKLVSARIWHFMINECMICRLRLTQDPCCSHFSWNSWTIYSIVWIAETKFGRYWNPTHEKDATAVCEFVCECLWICFEGKKMFFFTKLEFLNFCQDGTDTSGCSGKWWKMVYRSAIKNYV